MAAPTIIKGRDLMVFFQNKSIAYATNHTMTLTAETQDISSKDHGIYGASEVGKITFEITTENLYTTADYDALFAAMTAGNPVQVKFGIKQTPSNPDLVPADGSTGLQNWSPGSTYYQGNAIITSLVANAPNGEQATFTATFTGQGKIQKIGS